MGKRQGLYEGHKKPGNIFLFQASRLNTPIKKRAHLGSDLGGAHCHAGWKVEAKETAAANEKGLKSSSLCTSQGCRLSGDQK